MRDRNQKSKIEIKTKKNYNGGDYRKSVPEGRSLVEAICLAAEVVAATSW